MTDDSGSDVHGSPPDFLGFHDAEGEKIAGGDNANPTRHQRPGPLSDPKIRRYLAATAALFAIAVIGTVVVITSGHSTTVDAQADANAAHSTAAVAASQASAGQAFASQIAGVCATRKSQVVISGASQAISSGSEICQTAQSLAAQSIAVVPNSAGVTVESPAQLTILVTRTAAGVDSTATVTVLDPVTESVGQTLTVALPPGDPGVLTVTLPAPPGATFVGPTVAVTINQTETATVTEIPPPATETVTEIPAPVTETVTATETATTTETAVETVTVTETLPPP